MIKNSNPDVPFERQMLHILRNYQRLVDENLSLHTRCKNLQSGEAYSAQVRKNKDQQDLIHKLKERLRAYGNTSPEQVTVLRSKLQEEKLKRQKAEEALRNYMHKIKVLNIASQM